MSERAIALAFFRHIKLDKSAKRIFAFLSLNFCFMCVHSDSSNITVSIAGLIICLSKHDDGGGGGDDLDDGDDVVDDDGGGGGGEWWWW